MSTIHDPEPTAAAATQARGTTPIAWSGTPLGGTVTGDASYTGDGDYSDGYGGAGFDAVGKDDSWLSRNRSAVVAAALGAAAVAVVSAGLVVFGYVGSGLPRQVQIVPDSNIPAQQVAPPAVDAPALPPADSGGRPKQAPGGTQGPAGSVRGNAPAPRQAAPAQVAPAVPVAPAAPAAPPALVGPAAPPADAPKGPSVSLDKDGISINQPGEGGFSMGKDGMDISGPNGGNFHLGPPAGVNDKPVTPPAPPAPPAPQVGVGKAELAPRPKLDLAPTPPQLGLDNAQLVPTPDK